MLPGYRNTMRKLAAIDRQALNVAAQRRVANLVFAGRIDKRDLIYPVVFFTKQELPTKKRVAIEMRARLGPGIDPALVMTNPYVQEALCNAVAEVAGIPETLVKLKDVRKQVIPRRGVTFLEKDGARRRVQDDAGIIESALSCDASYQYVRLICKRN